MTKHKPDAGQHSQRRHSHSVTSDSATSPDLFDNHRLSEIARRIARLGGWRVDLVNEKLVWCETVATIHGLPADVQPSVEEAIDYYAPEHRELILQAFENCAEKGIPYDEELQIINQSSGERVWVRTTGEAVRDQSGNIIAVQGAFQDISERREVEERVLASEERFRLVARVTSDVIWDLDCVSGKLWCSDGLRTTFGHDIDHLDIDLNWWKDLAHPEEREFLMQSFEEALEGESEKWSGKYRIRRADGTYARVSDETLIMRDDDGRAVRAIGGIRDLTKELELENQIARAQRLDSIGQLTGGIAHDFNNLLTVILGNAELMTEMLEESHPARQLAEMVQSAAQRGSELTNRLLAFARRQALEPEPTDIARLINEMKPLLRQSLSADINLRIQHAEQLWSAQIDPVQLESSLLNLVINGRDAMPKGGYLQISTSNVVLESGDIEVLADLAPGEYVEISVTDTGIGIKPEHLDMIFQPFFTTKPKGKGTGLGLAMVWGFIKQSRGHVQIETEAGSGSTVRMYLPRVRHSTDDLSRERLAEPSTAPDSARILIVEDDELVLTHARRLLDSMGYEVTCAECGDVALELLKADPDFDLLFTDIIMPGALNGPALARKARDLVPDIRILFTSGYTEDAVSHHDLPGSTPRLLHKPYRRQELADKVSEALQHD